MKRALLSLFVLALVMAVLPLFASRGVMLTVAEGAVVLAIATMWNLLASFGGIVLVGLPLFIGIGAYSTYVIANSLGVPPHAVLPFAGMISAFAGLLISPMLFRLSGAQLAIGSWVMAEIGRLFVLQSNWLGAGGGLNLVAIKTVPRDIRFELNYAVSIAIMIFALTAVLLLARSRYGLALRALGDSENAASAVGIEAASIRRVALMLSAGIIGLAAGAYYIQVLQVNPGTAFGINWVAVVIFVVVLGGIGTIEGPIIGTAVYFVLRDSFAELGELYFVLMGALAIIVTIFAPNGLWGLIRSLLRKDLFPVVLLPRRAAPTSTSIEKG